MLSTVILTRPHSFLVDLDALNASPIRLFSVDELPPTVHYLLHYSSRLRGGGPSRNRTDDILLAGQALYQLSYEPKYFVVVLHTDLRYERGNEPRG